MARERCRALLFGALGLAAVAVAAASLDPSSEAAGGRSGVPFGGNVTRVSGGAETVITIPHPLLIALALVLLAYVVLAVLEDPRTAAAAVAKMVGAGLLVGLVVLVVLQFDFDLGGGYGTGLFDGGSLIGSGAGSGGGSGTGTDRTLPAPDLPAWALLAAFLAGVAGLAVATLGMGRLGGGDADGVPLAGADAGEPEPDQPLSDLGAAAGRSRVRLEGTVDADNEVYRAWREMTRLLAVARPESATPGEFAAAAVEAGMEPPLVDELTALFEDVRYGGSEPTEDVEARARSVMARIETRHDPNRTAASGDDGDGGEGVDGREGDR